jgi:predicted RNA-binding Zn-ribbon protein involved in translation (DUF1610 family)
MADEPKTNTSAELPPEQMERLRTHIATKWKNGCPMCGNRRWIPNAYAPVALSPRPVGVVLGGTMLPSLAMVCSNCGFTAFLNALVAGLLDGQ